MPLSPMLMLLWHRLHRIAAETHEQNQAQVDLAVAECQKLQPTRPCAAITACLAPNQRLQGAGSSHTHSASASSTIRGSKMLKGKKLPGQCRHESFWHNDIYKTPPQHALRQTTVTCRSRQGPRWHRPFVRPLSCCTLAAPWLCMPVPQPVRTLLPCPARDRPCTCTPQPAAGARAGIRGPGSIRRRQVCWRQGGLGGQKHPWVSGQGAVVLAGHQRPCVCL